MVIGCRQWTDICGAPRQHYAVSGTEISTTITNNRSILIYNGQLYQSTGSGTHRGVYDVGTGLPTGTGNVMTVDADLGSSGDSYGFVIIDNAGTKVMYVADNNNQMITIISNINKQPPYLKDTVAVCFNRRIINKPSGGSFSKDAIF